MGEKLRDAINNFMQGRYGADELTCTLGILGSLIAVIGSFANARLVSWIAILIILVAILRGLSKNLEARRSENTAFCTFAAKVPGLNKLVAGMGGGSVPNGHARSAGSSARKSEFDRNKRMAKRMWKERKTTAFLKCPNCGQILSVPKGKGKIRVTCPKCHAKMETKS